MAASVPMRGVLKSEENFCTLEATVVTGFESVAKQECKEKLDVEATTSRGRIFIEMPVESVTKVMELRTVDNIFVVIQCKENMTLAGEGTKEDALNAIKEEVLEMSWKKGLAVWKAMQAYQKNNDNINFSNRLVAELAERLLSEQTEGLQIETENKELPGNVSENPLNTGDAALVGHEVSSVDVSESEQNKNKGDQEPFEDAPDKFRVTCYRSGKDHEFPSPEAARALGGEINDRFGWTVDLDNFDLEVVLYIKSTAMYTCLALTKESLHRRNISHFGYTTLRATIAHNMLRLAKIKTGDIVCDPMCGSGAIPIEASMNWPSAVHICGECYPAVLDKVYKNFQALNCKLKLQRRSPLEVAIFNWDARHMPLKESCVDVFTTDLPFGKRHGTKADNRPLYYSVLSDMARCARLGSGRAVLLTHDKGSMGRAITRLNQFWRQTRVVGVNIGGLPSCVYVLKRSKLPWFTTGHPATTTESSGDAETDDQEPGNLSEREDLQESVGYYGVAQK